MVGGQFHNKGFVSFADIRYSEHVVEIRLRRSTWMIPHTGEGEEGGGGRRTEVDRSISEESSWGSKDEEAFPWELL